MERAGQGAGRRRRRRWRARRRHGGGRRWGRQKSVGGGEGGDLHDFMRVQLMSSLGANDMAESPF